MKILVLYGGTSNERDVSIQSGKSIIASLSKKNKVSGYDFNGNYNKLKEKCEREYKNFIKVLKLQG